MGQEQHKAGGLKRELGLLGVFSIATGAMISSGLFVLPGMAYRIAGPAVIISYALASIMMIPVMLSKAELSTAMPRSGGSYFYVERSLGPLMGSIAGFANWMSIMLKATFALVGIGTLGVLFLPGIDLWAIKVFALLGLVVFLLLNYFSTRKSGRVQIYLVMGLLAILVLYVGRGIGQVSETRYFPFLERGWRSIFTVSGMVFVSYGGLTKVVSMSEEVHNPTRNLPLGMILASLVVNALYVVVIFTTVGLVDGESLSNSLRPISLGAKSLVGPVGMILINVAAFLAFATTANSGIMSASRAPMAMSRDGLFPRVFSKVSKRSGTPQTAIVWTGVIMAFVIVFLDIETLIKTASTMMLLMFILVNISVIVMRGSGVQNYRPTFRAPLCPWLQIGSVVVYLFLIMEMGALPLLITGAFVLLSLIWYLAYVHVRIDRQSALMYMVKRILSRHIGQARLDEELVSIVLERDEVTFDRFDHLVKDCPVLDIDKPMNARELFQQVAKSLSTRLKMSEDNLYSLFLERERESSTVIKPGLAIPHIVLPGKNVFEIVLVRCKPGIVFSELNEPVRTAFVLVGTIDERNYHLKALMNIAHVVHEPGFDQRWMDARSEQQLKDIVLLSGRERQ